VPSRRALLACLGLLLPAPAQGDGGTVRLLERSGPFVITVFSAPEPVRVGAADVSVLVQDAQTGAPVLDADVAVEARSPDRTAAVRHEATRAQAINKLLYATALTPGAPGTWTLEVTVRRGSDVARVQCPLPVAPPRRGLVGIWPYLALPPVVIALYVLRAVLTRRRTHPSPRSSARA
jgi:hypothetical protein